MCGGRIDNFATMPSGVIHCYLRRHAPDLDGDNDEIEVGLLELVVTPLNEP